MISPTHTPSAAHARLTPTPPPQAGVTPRLAAEVITSRDALNRIANEWNPLLESSAVPSIFLTWEWISAWLDAVCPDARLFVVTFRDSVGRLVGIAPFYHTRMHLCHMVSYSCLRLLGDSDSGAEYPDVIIQVAFEDRVIAGLARVLYDRSDDWDCIWLPNVAGWTGAHQRFLAGWDSDLMYRHERPRSFAALALPESHDGYLALLGHKRRGYVKRVTRNLHTGHDTRLIRCESLSDLPEMLNALFVLHRKHWESAGECGSFVRRPKMRMFYERFSPLALEKGWLRLFALKVDGHILAVQFGYAYNGTAYALQEGYDPSSYDGIGNVLRNLVLKACIEEGLSAYDFLGEFTAHKHLWRAERRAGYDLFVGKRSAKNSLLFFRHVWPTGRFLRSYERCQPCDISDRHALV
jgi:CelD/BcsL family acetyltransferase involved in cellulose biosynthesis